MSLRYSHFIVAMAFTAAGGVVANIAHARNTVSASQVSFQDYVTNLAVHRYNSAENVVDLLRSSVKVEGDFHKNDENGILLSQRNGFSFGGGVNIDSIRISSTSKDGLAFINFNFNQKKCVYLQQIEKGLGKFSGSYVWIEQRNVYVKQLTAPDGVVYRAYMNRGSAMLPDCVVDFVVYIRGGYEKQP